MIRFFIIAILFVQAGAANSLERTIGQRTIDFSNIVKNGTFNPHRNSLHDNQRTMGRFNMFKALQIFFWSGKRSYLGFSLDFPVTEHHKEVVEECKKFSLIAMASHGNLQLTVQSDGDKEIPGANVAYNASGPGGYSNKFTAYVVNYPQHTVFCELIDTTAYKGTKPDGLGVTGVNH